MVTEATSYRSPKRKRDEFEFELSPPASPTSTLSVASLPGARLREEEEIGRFSPRTVVAGRLRDLALQEASLNADAPQSIQMVQWRSSSEPLAEHIGLSEEIGQSHIQISPRGSPVRLTEHSSRDAIQLEQHLSKQSSKTTKKSAKVIARDKLPAKSRKKSSPPPSENDPPNSLTWSDSEITGHNPTDPNDDGYGINGIGFKPTAAIAWARSQKRQKQMTDWKIREAKEAREKRRARREGASHINPEHRANGTTHKKVKFNLG
ncbi:hypothetical protein UA08_04348 [Talaromyces atroroseus]|uniref:Uncharacterized protein n=1 Tax=Talaromyces atroroseus TaxID=1441469 RepID=A0A1Q5Q8V5_TALAT|nr:hypothetical protein UA08_04348 [Talaromyces atroroseus]OKL60545.1 hypothetical protein UA08_04348 [Talaromyces atroroseus]